MAVTAGLMIATQLSKLKLDVRIIDKAAHPVLRGHADGTLNRRLPDSYARLMQTASRSTMQDWRGVPRARRRDTI